MPLGAPLPAPQSLETQLPRWADPGFAARGPSHSGTVARAPRGAHGSGRRPWGQDVGPGPAGLPGGVRVSHPRRGGSVVSRRNLPEHVRKQLENRGSAGLACESRRAARPPRGPPASPPL